VAGQNLKNLPIAHGVGRALRINFPPIQKNLKKFPPIIFFEIFPAYSKKFPPKLPVVHRLLHELRII
jgi:hypothetical protein